ncbi:hybrid sensor histidine kinase/response regulator transcription factor [Flavicella sediminum]|uniref:hybrid sensor histidine kinase/response regulator transcription factor n=1 Tax=Flavicella sediminum TaxID=2585141 RepID=UPI001123BA63|nr:hybrid sensor histidine kinase/response regulator transcription factor [Flavicella sediminum]
MLLFIPTCFFAQFDYTSLFETTDLPTTTVSRVRQDQKGFIWFTSEDGLFRFDGYRYIQHAFINNNPDFPLRGIKKIEFDHFGRIWLITKDNLLYCYLVESKNLQYIKFKNDKEASNVNSMTICENKLFVGRGDAPYYFHLKKLDFQHIVPIPLSDVNGGTRLGHSKDHMAWFVTSTYMVIFDAKKEKKIIEVDMPVRASSITVDDNYNTWIGNGSKSLQRFDFKTKKWELYYKLPAGIRWLEFDKKRNRLWITSGHNMYYFDFNESEKILHKLHMNRGFVMNYESFIDQQDNLWLVTSKDLIKINFRGNQFYDSNFHETFTQKNRKVISQDYSGAMLIGTVEDGLLRENFETGEREVFLPKKEIRFINKISDSLFYIGAKQGLFQLDFTASKENTITQIQPIGEKKHQVNAVVRTKENIYWIGTYGGLFRVDFSEKEPRFDNVIGWSTVDFICYDAENNVILTNAIHKGMFQILLDENHESIGVKNINRSKNLGSNTVQMMYKSGEFVWAATASGISKLSYNKEKKEYIVQKNYTTHQGLSNNYVTSIVAENEDVLWFGTHNGVNRFDQNSENFSTYYKGFGFLSNRITGRSAYYSKEGELYFGLNNGLVSFNPKTFNPSTYKYKVFIEDIEVNGVSGKTNKDLRHLNHYQNNLTFQISVPNYISPSAVKYRYKLENSEKGWIVNFVNSPTFTLNNLAVGNYQLLLQCTNEDGKWNSEIQRLVFFINPPFWLTWWFVFLSGTLVAASLFLSIRFTIIRQTRKKAMNLQLNLEKKLRETDQEKIKFFTNISHDLKTPLTMVKEPLEKILRNTLPTEEKQFLLETASNNANRLVKLVNQVLNFSTIHTGELTLNIQKIEFVRFIRTLVHNFKFQADQKNIDLIFDVDSENLPLYIDKEKIERVFFNIISNSFKNTPNGGKIIVKIIHEKENQSVKLIIEDTGKGIRRDKLKKIFSRFFQSDSEVQGQGIGLSIVKEYIEAHEGSVVIESEQNKGTKVLISLPSEEEKVEGTFDKIEEKKEFQHSILIAEDDDELRKYLTYELASKYKLFVANNGKRALEIVLNKMPDIVLTDLMMPELNGLELCKKIKEDIRTSHIPTIIITASGKNEIEVLDSGVNDYITKPFKTESLLLKIKNQLATINQTKEWFQREINLTPQTTDIESSGTLFLKNLMHVIEENFIENKLDISILTAKMNMSKSSLYKKTTQLTGMTVNELITSVKLTKAAELLSKSSYSFNEITFMLGYNDVKYFRELFKKKYSVTPTEYRKSL